MTSLSADYTPLPVAAEKVWTAWFGHDLERQPPLSQAMVPVRLPASLASLLDDGPVLEDSSEDYIRASYRPPSRAVSRVYHLSRFSRWRIAWSRLLHALFSSPLPVFHVQKDGSLSSLPPLIGGWPARPDRSLITFATGGSPLAGTLIVPTEALNEFISRLVALPGTSSTSTEFVAASGSEVAAPANADKPRGGAPPKHDAEAFLIEAFRLLYEGYVPKNAADLRRRALERYWESKQVSENGPQRLEPPSDEWAKPKIRRLWAILGLGSNR